MGTAVLANGRGRWLAIAVSLVVSAAMIYAQATERPCCVQTPTATSTNTAAVPPSTAPTASPAEVDMLAAGAPVAGQDFQMALPAGVASEQGLQIKTIWAARAISVLFPQISTIYGFRQDPLKWHPNGLAIDVMIPDHGSPAGVELGNQIAGYALANAKRWGVLHVIWRQKLYPGIGARAGRRITAPKPSTTTTTSISPPTAADTPPGRKATSSDPCGRCRHSDRLIGRSEQAGAARCGGSGNHR
ncbi:hypothetical protein BZL29_3593 [Mycobacterium kansasii]|uniref:ARB-07466-like C-terminal domain-containing protein n=1 Tax=Mycobacterium kansasii TaxID=1768 RepID=A0A1V3XE52_MYCKA|nr:hypothetical protein BZL29_3593 [Mycobacterium kansasii]